MSDNQQPGAGDGGVSWNPPVPGTSWAPGEANLEQPLPPPAYAAPQQGPAPRSGKGKRIGALVGAGALIAAGTFAVVNIAGGAEGGGDSPEDAVQRLFDSVSDEDLLGAMDVLLPGERRTFRQPMIDLVDNLQRLEILSDDADLGKVGGFDIEVELDQLDSEEVADDIANVTFAGDVTVVVDGEALPLGDLVIDDFLDGELPSGTERTRTSFGDDGTNRLTTVEHDGRWYVSLWYSVAETMRGEDGPDVPTRDEGIQPDGADSAEGAVEQLLQATADLDLEGMIATLDPDEFEALQRYAPIFLDGAQAELDDAGLELELRDLELRSESHGDDRASVGLDRFELEARGEGDSAVVRWDGECVAIEYDGDQQQGCAGDDVEGSAPEEAALITAASTLADSEPISAVRTDGEWYVGVLGSLLNGMNDALAEVQPGDIEDAIDQIDDIFAGVDETMSTGDLGDIFADSSTGGGSSDGPRGTDDTSDGGWEDTIPDTTEYTPEEETDVPESSAADECWGSSTGAEAVACFQELLAEGAVDPADVPVQLRYPECGLAEPWWDFYASMPDAEFVTLMESAHDCFAALVDAGELDSYDVPFEAMQPGCFDGANIYAIEDSEEYDQASDAYWDCVYG